jgi:spoIIIJ-associated protein
MEIYTGKNVEEALEKASKDTGVPKDELIYIDTGKTVGFISKKVQIEVYDLSDVIRYAEDYLLNATDSLGIESSVKSKLDDDIIRITLDSTHNPILIGKNGVTLQALNELVKLATNNHFHRRFRILLDINGYKDNKYSKLERLARKTAKDVQRSKTTYTFDPMPADERRAIHNALNGWRNIKTESIGEGSHRQVQIIYVEEKKDNSEE